jgi:group I intron endonuclease
MIDNIKYYENKLVIYKFTNLMNGKCYIGKTNNIKRRIKRHLNDIKSSKTYFHKALLKYGIDNFHINIVCICDDFNQLNEMEFHYIKQYKSRQYENGYNLTDGGEGSIGYIPTNETRQKISKSLKNRKFTKEWKQKISESKKRNYVKTEHPNYGKKLSIEVRQKISKSHKGKKVSTATKKKISEWNRSNKNKNRNTYIITKPDGTEIQTKFLSDFCKENDLVYSCMTKVCRGERKHHKGYIIKRLI